MDLSMKVGIYVEDFSKLGGVESSTKNLSATLSKHGVETVILTQNLSQDLRYESNILITHVGNTPLVDIVKTLSINVLIFQVQNIYVANNVLSKLKGISTLKIFSVLHNTPLLYLKFYRNRRKGLVFNVLKFLKHNFFTLLRNRGLLKKILEASDQFIVLSDNCEVELLNIFPFIDRKKVNVIPNLLPIQNSRQIDNSKKKNILIYAGRIDVTKNLDYAIKAWNLLPCEFDNWSFHIYGDGPDLSHLVKIKKDLAIKNLFFEGKTNNVMEKFSEAKFSILLSDFEGLPMMLLESISCGCIPIVTLSDGGVRDLVIEKELQVSRLSESAVAEVLIKTLGGYPQTRNKLISQSNKSIYFDNEAITERWIDLINFHLYG